MAERKIKKKKTTKKRAPAKARRKPSRVSKKPTAEKPGQVVLSTLPVYDLKGQKSQETVTLDPLFHEGPVNTDVLYQAILMYQAGEREGTACTKERGQVRGGGKKPWKQKGTGQARHGSRRSPIWRGGGVTHGPMPRDYTYLIPAQMRKRAVVEVIKEKVAHNRLFVVKNLELAAPKTKLVSNILEAFKLEKPVLLVEKKDENLTLASRNVRQVCVKTADEINALDLASHKECLMTKGAYAGLVKRLKG